MSLSVLLAFLLLPGELPVVESPDFSSELQAGTITATVHVRNVAQKVEGTGILIGKRDPFVYILTAYHVVDGADGLEIAVFSADSFPKPKTTYRSAQVVASTKGLVDLALVRLATTDPFPRMVRLCPEGRTSADSDFAGLTVGCADGKEPTCLLVKVVGKKQVRRQEGRETAVLWEVEQKLAPGRSGGPLLDNRGLLLGICSGTNREKTYFSPGEEIHTFLKKNGFRWLTEAKEGR